MKNLKKLMSVILAIALIASFAVIGAGAAFTDQDEITYETPVAVLTGAGVINGYDTGDFGPTDTLTREQAAKLICYALLGKTLADKLVCETDPFKDVPAKKWSAPFIAYCVSKGIVVGDGTGNFNPTDEVTGNQFAKMILCAMGYGKNGEFIGANWEINTAVEAYGLGLFTGSNADLSAPATREEAALYLFNAIELPFQIYSKDTDSYTNTNTTFATKLGLVKSSATDDFGHTGYTWTKAGAPITGFILDEVYKYTTTNGLWPQNALNVTVAPATGCVYYYNGEVVADINNLKVGDVAEFKVDATGAATKVVVVSKSFGYVAAVPTYNATTKALTMAIGTTTLSDIAKYDVPTDLVVGSAVLYVKTYNGALYVEKANAVSGQLKAVSSDAKSINFGGSLYKVSGASPLSLATPVFNVDATLYTDANGYALDVKGGSGPAARYAVLLNADKEPAPLFGQETNKIMILNPDGTIEVLTAAADYRTLDKNVWYKVGANATGTLLSDADTLETALAITGGKAAYADGHVGNANTVFVSYISGKVNVYTGIANLPSMTNASISAIAVNGIDTLVFISAGTATGTTAQDVAYLYTDVYTMTPDAVTAGAYDYVYSAVVDGAVTTLTFDNVNTDGTGLKAVTYTNGRVTGVGTATGYTDAEGTGAAANGIVKIGTSYFTYNDSTKVIIINNGVVTIGTAANIVADDNDKVTYKTPVTGSDLLTTVYIEKVAPTAPPV